MFNVDDSWKKKCLSSANAKWRQWKHALKKQHIIPFENKLEKLVNPPPGIGIGKEEWKDFVIHSTSEKSRVR